MLIAATTNTVHPMTGAATMAKAGRGAMGRNRLERSRGCGADAALRLIKGRFSTAGWNRGSGHAIVLSHQGFSRDHAASPVQEARVGWVSHRADDALLLALRI